MAAAIFVIPAQGAGGFASFAEGVLAELRQRQMPGALHVQGGPASAAAAAPCHLQSKLGWFGLRVSKRGNTYSGGEYTNRTEGHL